MNSYICPHCGKEVALVVEADSYTCWHCRREFTISTTPARTHIALVCAVPDGVSVSVWLDDHYLGLMGTPPWGRSNTSFHVEPGRHVLRVQRQGMLNRSPVELAFTTSGGQRQFLFGGTLLGGIYIKEIAWGP